MNELFHLIAVHRGWRTTGSPEKMFWGDSDIQLEIALEMMDNQLKTTERNCISS